MRTHDVSVVDRCWTFVKQLIFYGVWPQTLPGHLGMYPVCYLTAELHLKAFERSKSSSSHSDQ